MNPLSALLSSHVKAEIVCRLFSTSSRPIHLRELARAIDCSFSAVQREAKRMIEHGIIIEAKDGNRTYVHANVDYLFYKELQGLARKSKGSLEIVRKAIGNKGIDVAFVFGSLATETEQIESDVDLMILGDVGLREIVKRLSGISSQIGREINPHVMKVVEFTKRKINGDHFVVSICEHPKRFLVGSEDDLK